MAQEKRKRTTETRYGDFRGVSDPPGGLTRVKGPISARTRVGAVRDPWDPRGLRMQTARIHTGVDLLEHEHAHGRLSVAAYRTGRMVQAVFERAHGLKRGAPTYEPRSRGDAAAAQEAQVHRALDSAQAVLAWLERIDKAIGVVGRRLLRQVLDEGKSYAEISRLRGRGDSDRAVNQTAAQVRQLLEDLANELAKERTA